MAFAQAAARRPIPGAVATLGVSDRVTFLRKTYAHLGGALIAFALLTGAIVKYAPDFSLSVARLPFFLVFIVFIGGNMLAQRLALSETSRGLQYLGLALSIGIWALFLQDLIWFVMLKFGTTTHVTAGGMRVPEMNGAALSVIMESVVITLAIFVGLTLTVFITKKDFTFLRGILSVAMFAVLGVALASWLFGFTFGALLCGVVVMILAGYILMQTSLIMRHFHPQAYVAAALMLFGTVANLFIQILSIVASTRDR